MAIGFEAARLLVPSATVKFNLSKPATKARSMAKCIPGDMAVARTADAVQVFGDSGYIRGFEVERLYRDAKITQIYEGTNQIQRLIIARELMQAGATARTALSSARTLAADRPPSATTAPAQNSRLHRSGRLDPHLARALRRRVG